MRKDLGKQSLSEPYHVNGVVAHPNNRFFACDLDGNFLEEPEKWDIYINYPNLKHMLDYIDFDVCKEYQKTLDRVIFKGCYIEEVLKEEWLIFPNGRLGRFHAGMLNLFQYKTIESLSTLGLKLTKTGEQLLTGNLK